MLILLIGRCLSDALSGSGFSRIFRQLKELGGREDIVKRRLLDSLPATGFPCVERGVHNAQRTIPSLSGGSRRLAQAGFRVSADKHNVVHVEIREDKAEIGRVERILPRLG